MYTWLESILSGFVILIGVLYFDGPKWAAFLGALVVFTVSYRAQKILDAINKIR